MKGASSSETFFARDGEGFDSSSGKKGVEQSWCNIIKHEEVDTGKASLQRKNTSGASKGEAS